MTTRTEILCPNCLKKKLLVDGEECWCDQCGQEFIQTGTNSVKYK